MPIFLPPKLEPQAQNTVWQGFGRFQVSVIMIIIVIMIVIKTAKKWYAATRKAQKEHEMRGPAVDRDELFEVADRMIADGKDVTALTLHAELGRGSLTTIYKLLDEWKKLRPAPHTKTGDNGEVPEPVKAALLSTWRIASQEAGRQVEALKEKTDQEVAEARKQFTDALAAIAKLETENEAGAETIEILSAKVEEYAAQIVRLESQNAAQKATEDELRQQLKAQQAELDRLRKDLEQQRIERDSAMKEAATLKGKADTLKEQNDQLLKKIDDNQSKTKR